MSDETSQPPVVAEVADDAATKAQKETESSTAPFIIGIGSSAGGLEAIRELVKHLPKDAPATYVVVQHMSPVHKSLLTTLIGRETHLDVVDLVDGVEPAPNTVYVTPPNVDVVYRDGAIRHMATDPESISPKPSVDRFFLSVAENAKNRSVGVVLSGTGRDGAFGVQAIRGAGGITIAQDEQTAKYDGMPMAAVETGCVDLVLSPKEIGEHLSKIIASPRDLEQFRDDTVDEKPIAELMNIVLARTRVDFRDYKSTTIQRRLERRMLALGIDSQSEYVNVCRSNPHEVDSLFRDFLVSVTWFFRDPNEFNLITPAIREIAGRYTDKPARIWIAGCATGEEAYTIAILCAEALGGIDKLSKSTIQIFATDIDGEALETARKGRYSLASIDDVPREFVEKYFTVDEDSATVHPALKEVVIFSYHNVCQDPPFINVDLVCCRNLLIYFNAALQSKVLARLSYALTGKGVLFLGTAETVSVSDDLFIRVGESGHLYRKRRVTRSRGTSVRSGYSSPQPGARSTQSTDLAPTSRETQQVDRAMFDALARSVGSNSILVTDDHRIVRVYGDISRYIQITEATRLQMTLNMLIPPLGQEARTLSTVALRNKGMRKGIAHRLGRSKTKITQLEAFAIADDELDEKLVLISFAERTERATKRTSDQSKVEETDGYIESLERELASTRDALQQTIEELETANEELQSSNEELQSTNEELQAANEELETSNEELQSSNEELVTVNEELQVSTAELSLINDEQNAILQNVAAPMLIVDRALQISKASVEATRLFGLSPPLETPHLSQCALPRGFPILTDIANEALQYGRTVSREISSGRAFYTLRCAPFFNAKGQAHGATLTFMESEAATRLTSELEYVIAKAPILLMHRDDRGTIKRISGAYATAIGASQEAAIGRNIGEYLDGEAASKVIRNDNAFLRGGRATEASIEPLYKAGGGNDGWQQVIRYRYQVEETEPASIYVIGMDITERRRRELHLVQQNEQMALAQSIGDLGFWSIDLAEERLYWSETVFDIHGLKPGEYVPELSTAIDLYHPDDRERVAQLVNDAIEKCAPFRFEARLVKSDGEEAKVESRCTIQANAEGKAAQVLGVFRLI